MDSPIVGILARVEMGKSTQRLQEHTYNYGRMYRYTHRAVINLPPETEETCLATLTRYEKTKQ